MNSVFIFRIDRLIREADKDAIKERLINDIERGCLIVDQSTELAVLDHTGKIVYPVLTDK